MGVYVLATEGSVELAQKAQQKSQTPGQQLQSRLKWSITSFLEGTTGKEVRIDHNAVEDLAITLTDQIAADPSAYQREMPGNRPGMTGHSRNGSPGAPITTSAE